MTEATDVRYKADITAGALKLPESRLVADLLLRKVDAEGWKDAIVKKNVLQARNPATARRLTKLVRGRLETMGPDFSLQGAVVIAEHFRPLEEFARLDFDSEDFLAPEVIVNALHLAGPRRSRGDRDRQPQRPGIVLQQTADDRRFAAAGGAGQNN